MQKSVVVVVVALVLLSLLSSARAQYGFSFSPFGTAESEADSNVVALVAPLTLTGANTASFQTGDFVIYGGTFGVSVVPDVSNAASAANVNLNVSGLPHDYGDYGCAQRTGSNRFYLIDRNTSLSAGSIGYYSVYASTDAVTWASQLDSATQQLYATARSNDEFNLCVVDLQQNVYDISQYNTFKSSNLGVTWTIVPLTGPRWQNRSGFAGGIFTSRLTGVDTIMVLGGRQSATPQNNNNGGSDLNDVWSSSNGGASWTQVSAAAPWYPRDTFSWAASSQGVQVIFGGAILNGYGYYLGDLWVSVNDGANWVLLSPTVPSIGNFSLTTCIFDAQQYLYLFGGQNGIGSQYNWAQVSVKSTIALPLTLFIGASSTGPSGGGLAVATAHPLLILTLAIVCSLLLLSPRLLYSQ